MMRRLLWLAIVLVAWTTQLVAHHSIAGVYDRAQQVTLEGAIAEFHLVNPHAYLVLAVDSGDGRSEQWRLEMDNRYELVEVGVKTDTFKAGDRVVATGSRAHDGSRNIYLLRLDRRSDGFWYEQVGSSPKIGRAR